jgi:hypothetical protein
MIKSLVKRFQFPSENYNFRRNRSACGSFNGGVKKNRPKLISLAFEGQKNILGHVRIAGEAKCFFWSKYIQPIRTKWFFWSEYIQRKRANRFFWSLYTSLTRANGFFWGEYASRTGQKLFFWSKCVPQIHPKLLFWGKRAAVVRLEGIKIR